MRVNRLALLTTACAAALAGCGGGDKTASYCYSTDDSGFLLDSVRPEPGYVCVSTLIAEERSALDYVRPEPAMSKNGYVRSDSVRPEPAMSKGGYVRSDSVRPEPAMSKGGYVRSEPADSVRPEPAKSVHGTPTGTIGSSIKLQVMKEAELKRH